MENNFLNTIKFIHLRQVYLLLCENRGVVFSINDVCEFSGLGRKQVECVLKALVKRQVINKTVKKVGINNRYFYHAE